MKQAIIAQRAVLHQPHVQKDISVQKTIYARQRHARQAHIRQAQVQPAVTLVQTQNLRIQPLVQRQQVQIVHGLATVVIPRTVPAQHAMGIQLQLIIMKTVGIH